MIFISRYIRISIIVIMTISISCKSSRYQGQHTSKVKEDELRSKSDFNLKQAKKIVNDNAKDKPKNTRRAERKRAKLNKQMEEDKKERLKTVPTNRHKDAKPVPSYP